MMTPNEFEYLKRAMAELEKPPQIVTRAKIMRVMAQILNKAAAEYEREFQERVDDNIEREYQKQRNRDLMVQIRG
jgi:hypothetical protein